MNKIIQAVGIFSLILGSAFPARSAIVWDGPTTNFTQSAASPKDVLIPGAVSLTRRTTQWLFNPDGGDAGPKTGSPTDTEWAFGTLANHASLNYIPFSALRNGNLSGVLLPNKQMVAHLIKEDIYLSVMFTKWPHGGGFFAYTRSTPGTVTATPSVSITGPAAGAIFSAPANVTITAAASVDGGSVANVEFFANSVLSGSVSTAPFTLTSSNLAAGNYTLTAVATAGGISATSAPVNISVVTPVTISLSLPRVSRNQFLFDFTADPGLSYEVQSSSNLVTWQPISTSAASSNPSHFANGFVPNGSFYYRVKLAPNP